ncbi:MAG: D-alanyl-D-alanine carboxypeptidase family protein [Solirubrobacteraceae bacterium]
MSTLQRRVTAAALAAASLALAAAPAGAATTAPAVRAPTAILVAPATGDVVFARHASQQREVASTTKLMTALLTLERGRLGRMLTAIDYHGAAIESTMNLRPGERLTTADLLRGLLLVSANDAAATLATRIGGTEKKFVAMMNARARELGLTATHYANPVGLDDPRNHSSAEDLVKLTLILRRNAFFREVTNLRQARTRSGARPRTLLNRNLLVRSVPVVDGVKTGHTQQAGYVLVGSATRAGVTVVSAVLGDPSEAARDDDSLALLRYGLRRYHRVTAIRAGTVVGSVALAHRDTRSAVIATQTIQRVVRRGERVTRRVVGLPRTLDGPLPAGTRVGTVELRWRGRTIARMPAVTRSAIAEASFAQRAAGIFSNTLLVVVSGVVALGSLQLVLLRRRAVRRRRARRTGIA